MPRIPRGPVGTAGGAARDALTVPLTKAYDGAFFATFAGGRGCGPALAAFLAWEQGLHMQGSMQGIEHLCVQRRIFSHGTKHRKPMCDDLLPLVHHSQLRKHLRVARK